MEYLYGKLNKQVEPVEYIGSNTNTISVKVDNKTRTISADLVSAPQITEDKVKILDIFVNDIKVVDGTKSISIKIDKENSALLIYTE